MQLSSGELAEHVRGPGSTLALKDRKKILLECSGPRFSRIMFLQGLAVCTDIWA